MRTLLRGARPRDDRAQIDDRGLIGHGLGRLDRGVQGVDVLPILTTAGPVHPLGVPPVGGVAGEDVLGEGDVGVALNRDVVVVPNQNQVAKCLGASEGRSLGGDALLEAAIASDDVDEVIKRALARGCLRVEQAALTACGHGHADGAGQARTEGAGGDLHTGGVLVLGVTRSLGTPGAQRLEVRQFEAPAAEVELDVLRQARVSG